ncbi:hypothetical protein [Amycolatopsis sp. NPDC051716]|uniref:hypothetical protein n=1 Tax=Amycolatopsis sp. NPDC051716 TaxID=3155804 RepID=UPI00342F73FE
MNELQPFDKEPVPGFWKRALNSPSNVAAAGLGAGAAFFSDASWNLFPFADPLVTAAPGAAAALGLYGCASLASKRIRSQWQMVRALKFANKLEDEKRPKLAREVRKTVLAYRAGQIPLTDAIDRIDKIVDKYLNS